MFDDPLAAHHKLIGRWVASRGDENKTFTRVEVRRHIEQVFGGAVSEVLCAMDFVELRCVVLHGSDEDPPAIILICDSIGQLDLGWIEASDAPVAWRAAAYGALERMLGRVLPVFGYQDLFDEIALYYWDGETEDDGALQALVDYHGADPDDRENLSLPSEMNGRRPEWMIAANAGRPGSLPVGLRCALHELTKAHRAIDRGASEWNAWSFDPETLYGYIPGIEECSSLPPLTLVPVEQFTCEVDDVGRQGMEMGFMDVAGICPVREAKHVDDWFESLRRGVRFLAAAQALIRLDPTTF